MKKSNNEYNIVSSELNNLDSEFRKRVIRQIQIREKRRRQIVAICSVFAIICIGYVVFYYFYVTKNNSDYAKLSDMLKNPIENRDASIINNYILDESGRQQQLEVLEKYKDLYNKNKKLIGWIKIADTSIDYPVLQTVNNEYYLDHNYKQEYDKNGSIFMDKDCDIIKPSTNLILYGHHMKSGKMFGSLDAYCNEKYYKAHPIIQFDTIYEERAYQVMYVFRSKVYYEDEITFKYYQFINADSGKEFDSNMDQMRELSMYDTGVKANYGDELLTLSTCDNHEEDGRFVVVARRIR